MQNKGVDTKISTELGRRLRWPDILFLKLEIQICKKIRCEFLCEQGWKFTNNLLHLQSAKMFDYFWLWVSLSTSNEAIYNNLA